MPVEGVEIGTPVASDTDVVLCDMPNVVGTFRLLGRLGLLIIDGAIELSISFLAGDGCENRLSPSESSTSSVLTLGSPFENLFSSRPNVNGFTSGGLTGRAAPVC